jgi:hypothetical protein
MALKVEVDTNPRTGIKPKSDPNDPSKWLTRNEATDMLHCARATLSNYEARGYLHPKYIKRTDARGASQNTVVYSQEELKRLAARMKRSTMRDPGDIAALAYDLFDEGKPLREMVKILRVTPEMLEHLRNKWLDMGKNDDLLISPTTKERLTQYTGAFDTIIDLIDRLSDLMITPVAKERLEQLVGGFDTTSELIDAVEGLK